MGEGHQQAVLCVRKLVDLFLTGLLLGTEEQHIGGTARKGETKDGLDSISGGSAWKHLEREEQTTLNRAARECLSEEVTLKQKLE